MYIKSIVLDGFKSYGSRVEVNGFDPQFNAVTGLNGTGKSNILDAICFVLGMTNLSNMRATNLQDFIYKLGQAGVHKATVTIRFDNTNKDHSPPGYESNHEITISRQVAMGGKNKYMLDGSNVPNKKVADLFGSVQLNVNNPHFLIMQGRVTKVLNMRPPDILAMVEEAAGTRMYETKRLFTLKTLEKKDAKLDELNTIIKDDLTPKLEKLKEEKSKYLELQRVGRELEHLLGLYRSWQLLAAQRGTLAATNNFNKVNDKLKSIEDVIEANKEAANKMEDEIAEMRQTAHNKTGSKLQVLEIQLKEVDKLEAKASAAEQAAKEDIESEKKKAQQLTKSLNEEEAGLKKAEAEYEKSAGKFDKLKSEAATDAEALALAQRKYQAACTGMEINEDGQEQTLQDQLMEVKAQVTETKTNLNKYNMEINQCRSKLKDKQRLSGSSTVSYEKDRKQLEALVNDVKKIEGTLENTNYSEERAAQLQTKREELLMGMRGLRDKIDRIEDRNVRANFNYRDPEANFNRKSVCGMVCRLFNVTDQINCTALETAAGGRLYNVVVDTEVTSKKLLQNGNLQSRTTFIPLNKIQGGRMADNVIRAAQNLVGAENVQPALSLIQYDRKLQGAMEHIFGYTFVAKDLNIARKVTFDNRIRMRCVTLDGDSTDPSGVLTGGARQKAPSILLMLQELKTYEADLAPLNAQLEKIDTEMERLNQVEQEFSHLKRQFNTKTGELNTLKLRLQGSTHHQQVEEVENLKTTIADLMGKINENEPLLATFEDKAKELTNTIKDSKGHRERKLTQANAEVKSSTAKSAASKKAWELCEQTAERLKMEVQEFRKNVENYRAQLEECTALDENDFRSKKEIADDIRQKKAQLAKEVKAEKEQITASNKTMKKLNDKKEALINKNSELVLECKKQNHVIAEAEEQMQNAKVRETDAIRAVGKDDKHRAAAENLNDSEAGDLQRKIRTNQEKKTKMSRSVNEKAQRMLDDEEKQFNFTMKQMRIVKNDRKTLQQTIADLDTKKKAAIELAFTQVSKDFGSIFQSLLPGANAKLKVPDNMTILQGLEIKVSLGGIWKDNLSELSGGQRSLAALSLILAMLLFKPAPLYILDEVDAALDLSHTQNIGKMLQSHFKQSQFIIVSLKDGMFNNADVLFRTSFVDGMSAVNRTVNSNKNRYN